MVLVWPSHTKLTPSTSTLSVRACVHVQQYPASKKRTGAAGVVEETPEGTRAREEFEVAPERGAPDPCLDRASTSTAVAVLLSPACCCSGCKAPGRINARK